MTQYNMIIKFVKNELCNGNRDHNATAYDGDRFDGAMNVRISFDRKPREQYNALLRFCADNDITIANTHPATLETVVRVSTEEVR